MTFHQEFTAALWMSCSIGSVNPARGEKPSEHLQRLVGLLAGRADVSRVIVFGSFVTTKPEPNDVDVFLVMDDSFDLSIVTACFSSMPPHNPTSARASSGFVDQPAFLTEEEMVAGWGLKRDGTHRGVIEIERDAS